MRRVSKNEDFGPCESDEGIKRKPYHSSKAWRICQIAYP